MGFVTSPKVTSTPRDHLSEGHQIKIKSINHEAVTQCPERARMKKGKLHGPCFAEGGRGRQYVCGQSQGSSCGDFRKAGAIL